MKKILLICTLFVCTSLHSFDANELNTRYGIIKDPRYSAAFGNSMQACLIQSGLKGHIDTFNALVAAESKKQIALIMARYIPIEPRKIYTLLAIGQAIAKKEIKTNFRNPIFPSVTNSLVLNEKGGYIDMKLIF